MCGLSGSAWAVAPLVASQKKVAEYIVDLQERVKPQEFSAEHNKLVANLIKVVRTFTNKDVSWEGILSHIFALSTDIDYKLLQILQERFIQHKGVVGLYGHALARVLLQNMKVNGKVSPHSIMLSDLFSS